MVISQINQLQFQGHFRANNRVSECFDLRMASATQRLEPKQQTLEDAYSPPANFLEIDVCSPQVHGDGKTRFVDYEVKLKVLLLVMTLLS